MPGLVGTILTMTMVIMTSLAVTRERERGTMENLLATPVTPLEVMIGKLLPFIGMGLVQVTVIIAAAALLFGVPMLGSPAALATALLAFIAANLAVGFLFSTLAGNQLQAMQMSFFFFLPSILMSGFMFPFKGMPQWAQWIGEILPLDPFPADRARRDAQGERVRRGLAQPLAAAAVPASPSRPWRWRATSGRWTEFGASRLA